jgi:hypothetical protein
VSEASAEPESFVDEDTGDGDRGVGEGRELVDERDSRVSRSASHDVAIRNSVSRLCCGEAYLRYE